MIHAFIANRLHYCYSLPYGVPGHHMQKFQRVMNASARLIFCASKYCHITQLLQQLHWQPIRTRIEFKTLLITFKVLQGSAPKYLIDLISVLLHLDRTFISVALLFFENILFISCFWFISLSPSCYVIW